MWCRVYHVFLIFSHLWQYDRGGLTSRGFDTFVEGCMWLHGGCLSAKLFAALDRVDEPFLLYAHYMEPHSPYDPPGNFKRRFSGEYDGFDFIRNGDPRPIGAMLYDNGPEYDLGARDIQHLIDLYDDEIRSFDGVFQRLIGRLRDKGLLEHSIIALVSDHGEEFLEHGHIEHCRGIWTTLSHVPMILWVPDIQGGRRVEGAVENIDLVPTLLDYVGIAVDGLGFEGESLRPLIDGSSTDQTFAFSDQGRYRTAADKRFHLILDGEDHALTLFDVIEDPLELHDLYTPEHPAAAPLAAALYRWLEATGQLMRFDQDLAAAKAREEELRALGYLE